jgi:N-acetylmuramic acid 6-phosphate etherase
MVFIWYYQNMKLSPTESYLHDAFGIDTWEDARILDALLAGQQRAVDAVRRALPQISQAATNLADRLKNGGKLIYAGAGTSIRSALQDGSELPATFGMPEEQIFYLIAGGRNAMFDTLAEAEDDTADGRRQAEICAAGDTLVAVAASGSTPFTLAAAERAMELGSFIIAVVSNPDSALGRLADIEILLDTGPEVIMGSTRMSAGTAQKAALNLLSTLVHIRLGAVYDGLMVNVRADNAKLLKRAGRIVAQISGTDETRALSALEAAKGHVKPAVLLCSGVQSPALASETINKAQGNLRLALSRVRSQ